MNLPEFRDPWPGTSLGRFFYYEDELFPSELMTFGPIQIYGPRIKKPYLDRAYGPNWKTDVLVSSYGKYPWLNFYLPITADPRLSCPAPRNDHPDFRT